MVLFALALLSVFAPFCAPLDCVQETRLGSELALLMNEQISPTIQNLTQRHETCKVGNDFCVTLTFGEQLMKGCSSDIGIHLLASQCWEKRVQAESITSMLLNGTNAVLSCCDSDLCNSSSTTSASWLLFAFMTLFSIKAF
uniref:UPAR/Ly6 domain-containing protein n=1 Tax=Steinernema glaseri TaxID=37863 RepID=A0A1I7Z9X7_9BILA